MKSIYLSPLRVWARRLGITQLYSLPSRLRTWRRKSVYRKSRPDSVEVAVANCAARMLVGDEIEYVRVLSYKEDRHILQAFINRLKPGDSYWDVGSSLGLYAVLLAKAVGPQGSIVAFEPERRSCERLKQNVAANSLPNVRVVPLALYRERAQLELSVQAVPSSGVHSLVQRGGNGDARTPQTVEVIPGDEFRQQENLPVPAAVKVDVEGAEEDVLLGLRDTLRNPACHTVICEVHFAVLAAARKGDVPARIGSFLAECGFTRTAWLDHSHLAAYKDKQ